MKIKKNMSALDKAAAREFKKLPREEQERFNSLRRLPMPPPTVTHGHGRYCKADRKWSADGWSRG